MECVVSSTAVPACARRRWITPHVRLQGHARQCALANGSASGRFANQQALKRGDHPAIQRSKKLPAIAHQRQAKLSRRGCRPSPPGVWVHATGRLVQDHHYRRRESAWEAVGHTWHSQTMQVQVPPPGRRSVELDRPAKQSVPSIQLPPTRGVTHKGKRHRQLAPLAARQRPRRRPQLLLKPNLGRRSGGHLDALLPVCRQRDKGRQGEAQAGRVANGGWSGCGQAARGRALFG